MIRKLTIKDHQQVLNYLQVLPSFSLFLVADIEKYGYDGHVFTVWGVFNQAQELLYVFGKYYNTLVVYSNADDYPAAEIFSYLNTQSIEFDILLGRSILVEQFLKQLTFSNIFRNYYCELKQENFTPLVNPELTVTKADLAQTKSILALLNSIEEFPSSSFHEEALRTYIEDDGIYLIMEKDEIASLAMCSARTKQLANIGGVCTAKPYRRKGYASTVVSALSKHYLEQGLICCLGYNNPAAGAIYQRLGYQPVGQTIIATK